MIASASDVVANVGWSLLAAIVVFIFTMARFGARRGYLRFGWKATAILVFGIWMVLFLLFSMAPIGL
jgi:hypothetical protein